MMIDKYRNLLLLLRSILDAISISVSRGSIPGTLPEPSRSIPGAFLVGHLLGHSPGHSLLYLTGKL